MNVLVRPRSPAASATRIRSAFWLLAFLAGSASHAAAFDLQAHRGGRGLMPENTLAAFENALAIGVTTLELDIAITADGVAVISHDPHLNQALVRDSQGRWLDDAGPLLLRDYASVAHMIKGAGGTIWSPNSNAVDEAAVKEAQRLGLQVIPWTVNALADMRKLMDWGVDGIITDRPDRLRELMKERGLPLPAPVTRRRAP